MFGGQIDEPLVAALYGTALRGEGWRPALERLRGILDSADASVTFFAADGKMLNESTDRIVTAEARALYISRYGRIDPKETIFARRDPGFLFNDVNHFDEGFVARNPFYQEFTRSLGSRHTLDMLVERSGLRRIYLAAMRTRTQGAYDQGAEARFRQAARHFALALNLREKIDAAEALRRESEAALDRLCFGLVILDRSGRVSLANSAALSAIREGRSLKVKDGRLSAQAHECERRFDDMIAKALKSALPVPEVLRLSRPGGGYDVVWVVKLSPAHALSNDGGALVLFGEPRARRQPEPEELMALFGFTRAEAALAVSLARGKTLAEAAAERGVKVATCRSQLLAVLSKAGVHRQADLIRLLATLPGGLIAAEMRIETKS
jgi:DNA-binding CsgD family transcriptional regulator